MPWDAAKAMLLRPTNVDLPECDCHLPPMESGGRRSRPVGVMHHVVRSSHTWKGFFVLFPSAWIDAKCQEDRILKN